MSNEICECGHKHRFPDIGNIECHCGCKIFKPAEQNKIDKAVIRAINELREMPKEEF